LPAELPKGPSSVSTHYLAMLESLVFFFFVS
jgi:hypothetical protein